MTASVLGLAAILATTTAAAAAEPDHRRPSTPIKHVIEVMLENHSFDNLFGRFPGADGIPAGATLPNPQSYFTESPPVAPVWAKTNQGTVQGGIDNSRAGLQMAMDYQPGRGYAMDNFTRYPADGMSSITEFDPSFDPNLQYLAGEYELADHNFQPAIAASNTNIHYALNGTGNGWMYNNLQPGTTNSTWHSIFKQLDAADFSAKLYYGLPPSTLSQYWYQQFPTDRTGDVSSDTQFFTDLATGQLPTFSLVRPDYAHYNGEPNQDVQQADTWLGQVMDAIGKSPEWQSTAVFVTFDESGGFWDHVAPPTVDQYGYGPRTPTVIVSPYARHQVFHPESTNISVLSFIQHNFGLPPLTQLNARQNDFMAAFNFHQAPLAAPQMPQAPAETIGFYDSTDTPGPGRAMTVNLQANTPALTLDSAVNKPVSLTVIPPTGVAPPAGFPSSINLTDGKASFSTTFKTPGYYRIHASGDGLEGWVTICVGVTPNTTP